MKNIQIPILLTTFYLVLYVACLELLGAGSISLILFGFSPVILIWMVIRVLKDGVPSGKKFDDHFYDDHNYTRVQVREAVDHPQMIEEED